MHLNRIILPVAILAAAALSACDTARPVEDAPGGGGLHAEGYGAADQHGPDALTSLATCRSCHGETLDGDVGPSCNACHEDRGYVNWQSNCTFCHGQRSTSYQAPADLAKAAPATGAHQKHLSGTTSYPAVACETCHVVPTTLAHVDGQAQVTFSGVANTGTTSTFGGTTCTTYCHGATLAGGTAPAWSGSGVTCSSCHGNPPATGEHARHAQKGIACSVCHPLGSATHVNGAPQVVRNGTVIDGWACGTCHNL